MAHEKTKLDQCCEKKILFLIKKEDYVNNGVASEKSGLDNVEQHSSYMAKH